VAPESQRCSAPAPSRQPWLTPRAGHGRLLGAAAQSPRKMMSEGQTVPGGSRAGVPLGRREPGVKAIGEAAPSPSQVQQGAGRVADGASPGPCDHWADGEAALRSRQDIEHQQGPWPGTAVPAVQPKSWPQLQCSSWVKGDAGISQLMLARYGCSVAELA